MDTCRTSLSRKTTEFVFKRLLADSHEVRQLVYDKYEVRKFGLFVGVDSFVVLPNVAYAAGLEQLVAAFHLVD